jgi:hypothetical protein
MIIETMESETRRIFEEIRDSSSPFGTWEITSPFAGSYDVMCAIPSLGNFHGNFALIWNAPRT